MQELLAILPSCEGNGMTVEKAARVYLIRDIQDAKPYPSVVWYR